MSSFSERLASYRTSLGMTQKALAERSGLTSSHFNRIEKGTRRPPRIEHIRMMAKALRLTPEEAAELVQLAGYSPLALQPNADTAGTEQVPVMREIQTKNQGVAVKVEGGTNHHSGKATTDIITVDRRSKAGAAGAHVHFMVDQASNILQEKHEERSTDRSEGDLPDAISPALVAITQRLELTAQQHERANEGIVSAVEDALSRFQEGLPSTGDRTPVTGARSTVDPAANLSQAKSHLKEAVQARDRNDYVLAEEWYGRALAVLGIVRPGSVLVDAKLRPVVIETLSGFVATGYHLGKVKNAFQRAQEGLRWCREDPDSLADQVDFLIWRAELFDLSGQADLAADTLEEADQLLNGEIWPPNKSKVFLIASALRVRGAITVRRGTQRADWAEAEGLFSQSIEVAKAGAKAGEITEAMRKALTAYAERDLCRLRIRQGDLPSAIAHAEKSHTLRQALGHGRRATAHHFAHLADVNRSNSNDVANMHLRIFDALDGFEEIGDDLDVARMHLRLARLYRKDGRPREARHWAERARSFGRRAELPLYQALAHRQLGLAWEQESDIPQSENHLRASIGILAELQDHFEHAVSQRALGGMLARRWQAGGSKRDRDEAHNLLTTAETMFDALGATIERQKAHLAQGPLDPLAEAKDETPLAEAKVGNMLVFSVDKTKRSIKKQGLSPKMAEREKAQVPRLGADTQFLGSAARDDLAGTVW